MRFTYKFNNLDKSKRRIQLLGLSILIIGNIIFILIYDANYGIGYAVAIQLFLLIFMGILINPFFPTIIIIEENNFNIHKRKSIWLFYKYKMRIPFNTIKYYCYEENTLTIIRSDIYDFYTINIIQNMNNNFDQLERLIMILKENGTEEMNYDSFIHQIKDLKKSTPEMKKKIDGVLANQIMRNF